jgi:hypothetical protein
LGRDDRGAGKNAEGDRGKQCRTGEAGIFHGSIF